MHRVALTYGEKIKENPALSEDGSGGHGGSVWDEGHGTA